MKKFKFFITVACLLIASALILTGCMLAFAEADITTQGYEMESDPATIIDTPTPQTELDKKFWAMYETNEATKTITVISEDFLKDYWRSNYEEKVMRSLTTEEVLYIIQDSIRLYKRYSTIIMPGFEAQTDNDEIAQRFPELSQMLILHEGKIEYISEKEDQQCIYDLIIYRLRALSSPEAFVLGADAIEYAGGTPETYSSLNPESLFYVPGLTNGSDMDMILKSFGQGKGNPSFPYFYMGLPFENKYTAINEKYEIELRNKGGHKAVYPISELKMMKFHTYENWIEIKENHHRLETILCLQPYDASFTLQSYYQDERMIRGKFKIDDDYIILYPETDSEQNEYYYTFKLQYKDAYSYNLYYLPNLSVPLGEDIFPIRPDFSVMKHSTLNSLQTEDISCNISLLSDEENERISALFHAPQPESYSIKHNTDCSVRLHLRTKDVKITFCNCNVLACSEYFDEWYSGGCIVRMMDQKMLSGDEITLIDDILAKRMG